VPVTRIVQVVVVLLGIGACLPAGATADTSATTGNATSVTGSSAELHGVVDPASTDSQWAFEYSTSPQFNSATQLTTAQTAGPGVEAVSATVTNLRPVTTYYYRVLDYHQAGTPYGPDYDAGNTVSFTTLSAPVATISGRALLDRSTFAVTQDVAPVKMTCSGKTGALCKGRLALSTKADQKTVTCGSGEFISAVPHTHIVRIRLGSGCGRLLKSAKDHRLAATLQVIFSTQQAKLTRSVALVS